MTISLATVFVLNAIALFIFPVLGHWLNLSQHQFGVWAAIAIHDTSSVVGAGSAFGEEALKVATTVKLTRALWIIPLSVFTTFYFKSKSDKLYIPWFILFFIIAMIINTCLNIPKQITSAIVTVLHQSLTLTLFFMVPDYPAVLLKQLELNRLCWVFRYGFSSGLSACNLSFYSINKSQTGFILTVKKIRKSIFY